MDPGNRRAGRVGNIPTRRLDKAGDNEPGTSRLQALADLSVMSKSTWTIAQMAGWRVVVNPWILGTSTDGSSISNPGRKEQGRWLTQRGTCTSPALHPGSSGSPPADTCWNSSSTEKRSSNQRCFSSAKKSLQAVQKKQCHGLASMFSPQTAFTEEM